jgi:Cation efflux family
MGRDPIAGIFFGREFPKMRNEALGQVILTRQIGPFATGGKMVRRSSMITMRSPDVARPCRREFITLLTGATATWPIAVRAQQMVLPVVGILTPRASGDAPQLMDAVRQGLKDAGFRRSERRDRISVCRERQRTAYVFLGEAHERNERKTWAVIAVCAAMMVAEIVGGLWFGSVALIGDGLHISTHAGALLIAALAYTYSRS